jgi:hypothetical protein
MRERPILFSGPMVRAIMDGRKTMTRRVVKPQPEMVFDGESLSDGNAYGGWEPKLPPWSKWPYQLGDTLWVRETWKLWEDPQDGHDWVLYRAGGKMSFPNVPDLPMPNDPFADKWKPSIFMPHWASRITLEVTGVRVERLQEITEKDAISEGIISSDYDKTYRYAFSVLWDSINGKKYPWSDNPWVWVIEFRHMGRE